jgi:hypothetical protein
LDPSVRIVEPKAFDVSLDITVPICANTLPSLLPPMFTAPGKFLSYLRWIDSKLFYKSVLTARLVRESPNEILAVSK